MGLTSCLFNQQTEREADDRDGKSKNVRGFNADDGIPS